MGIKFRMQKWINILLISIIYFTLGCSVKDEIRPIIPDFTENDVFCVSNDEKFIATASDDHSIKIWNSSGKIIKIFRWQSNHIEKVSFSKNGKLILIQELLGLKIYDLNENLVYENKDVSWSDLEGEILVTVTDTTVFVDDPFDVSTKSRIIYYEVSDSAKSISYKNEFIKNRKIDFFDVEKNRLLLCYNTKSDSTGYLEDDNLEIVDFQGKTQVLFRSNRELFKILDWELIDFSPDCKSVFIGNNRYGKEEFSALYNSSDGKLLKFFNKTEFNQFSKSGDLLILEGIDNEYGFDDFRGVMIMDVFENKKYHFAKKDHVYDAKLSNSEKNLYLNTNHGLYVINVDSCVVPNSILSEVDAKEIKDSILIKNKIPPQSILNDYNSYTSYFAITVGIFALSILFFNYKRKNVIITKPVLRKTEIKVLNQNVRIEPKLKSGNSVLNKIAQIKEDIKTGDISSTLKKLNSLTKIVHRFEIESTNLTSRYSNLNRSIRNGLISNEIQFTEQNKIVHAILEILADIEEKYNSE